MTCGDSNLLKSHQKNSHFFVFPSNDEQVEVMSPCQTVSDGGLSRERCGACQPSLEHHWSRAWGGSCNPVLNGKIHYPLPADIDKLLHDDAAKKIREYRADYNYRPSTPTSFMAADATTSGRLHCELV